MVRAPHVEHVTRLVFVAPQARHGQLAPALTRDVTPVPIIRDASQSRRAKRKNRSGSKDLKSTQDKWPTGAHLSHTRSRIVPRPAPYRVEKDHVRSPVTRTSKQTSQYSPCWSSEWFA
jgi:hypothetical protein